MKICIPTLNDNGLNSSISHHFGRSQYFIVIDTDNSEVVKTIANSKNKPHGKCAPVDLIKDSGAEAMVCYGLGMGAINSLCSIGIDAYKYEGEDNIKKAVESFKNGELVKFDEKDGCAGQHQH